MTEIQVKVTVKDIDDNDPIFTQTNITTGNAKITGCLIMLKEKHVNFIKLKHFRCTVECSTSY
jgi:hypothetical protein